MLEWFHWALIALWALAFISAWKVPRAALWLALGALSYVISAWWHVHGLPYAVGVGAATNIGIVVVMFFRAKERWEMMVWQCITMMLLLDVLRVSGLVTQLQFAMSLEAVNAAAMVLIGTTGIMDRIKAGDIHPRIAGHRSVLSLHRALFAKREPYPRWWKEP